MNKLIAISGDKGAGKSHVARMIASIAGSEYGEEYRAYSFASVLKDVVAVLTGCSREALNDQGFKTLKSPIRNTNGDCYTYRQCLQFVGDKMRELNPDIFVDSLFREVDLGYGTLIDDARMPNEFAAIRERGGVVIRVERPGLNSTDTHISETASRQEKYDHVIVNDSTLEALREKVAGLVRGLQTA